MKFGIFATDPVTIAPRALQTQSESMTMPAECLQLISEQKGNGRGVSFHVILIR